MKQLRDESIDDILEPLANLPTGIKAKGQWVQDNLTALGLKIDDAYRAGHSAEAKSLEKVEQALSRAAEKAMTKEQKAAYDLARKEWASLRMLETGKIVDGGNVVPSRLDSGMLSRYRHNYKEGKIPGELADIGKLAQTYKALPQSGTQPREFYARAAQLAAAGGVGASAYGSQGADPTGGMLSAASVFLAPPVLQKMMQSETGRKYLTKGLVPMTKEMERYLMLTGAGLGAPLSLAGE
jgi:hypothetical protein